jgi:uridine kinase
VAGFDTRGEVHRAALGVLDRLESLRSNRELVLVGIDGHSGAGKSTLAEAIGAADDAVEIIHSDSFYRPPSQRPWPPVGNEEAGHEFELGRLEEEVLVPLSRAEGGVYTPRDFQSGRKLPSRPLPRRGVAVVEGIYSMVKPLRRHYDHTVWVNCPLDRCLDRVLARDGASQHRDKFVDVWFPQEERYIAEHEPHLAASQIVNSDGEAPRE